MAIRRGLTSIRGLRRAERPGDTSRCQPTCVPSRPTRRAWVW